MCWWLIASGGSLLSGFPTWQLSPNLYFELWEESLFPPPAIQKLFKLIASSFSLRNYLHLISKSLCQTQNTAWIFAFPTSDLRLRSDPWPGICLSIPESPLLATARLSLKCLTFISCFMWLFYYSSIFNEIITLCLIIPLLRGSRQRLFQESNILQHWAGAYSI